MKASAKKIQATPDTLIRAIPGIHPVDILADVQIRCSADWFPSLRYVSGEAIEIQKEERPTMNINDLFDGIVKSINQFADEIAEQRLHPCGTRL